jgi:nucleotide-binding universal stress UspA family protein
MTEEEFTMPHDIKTILLPVDFSDSSEMLAGYANQFAANFKAKVYILHVVTSLDDYTGLYVPHISLETVMNEVYHSAQKALNDFSLRYFDSKTAHESILAKGEPYKEILRVAEAQKADIIIMGTHGRSGLDNFIFGSTIERVLRGSVCPVLTVKVTR